MSILEKNREVSAETLMNYLPQATVSNLPVLVRNESKSGNEFSERELLYKVLFDMKKDMNDMKLLINEIMHQNPTDPVWQQKKAQLISSMEDGGTVKDENKMTIQPANNSSGVSYAPVHNHVEVEESLSLTEKEKEFIQKALVKHKGKRKQAAQELGISERTLYRKMNEYGLH
jgi:hypothetical protein